MQSRIYFGTSGGQGPVTLQLNNNQYLTSKNADNSGTVNIIKVNPSNQIELASIPYVTGQGALALLSQVPDVTALQNQINSLSSDVSTLQSDVSSLNSSVSSLNSQVSTLNGLQGTYLLLNGTRSMTGALNMASFKITNVLNPTNAQDAATKSYTDGLVGPLAASISALQSDVSSLNSSVSTLNSQVSSLNSQVSTLNGLQASYLLLNGTRPMTGALNMGSFKITNVLNPTNAQDAATKAYTDGLISNLETIISNIQSDIYALGVRITSLEGSISSINSSISTINSQISSLTSSISTLSNLQSSYLLLDGTRTMTGALNMGSFKITNVSNPTNAQDAVTKAYVDNITGPLATSITNLQNDVNSINSSISTINSQISSLTSSVNTKLNNNGDTAYGIYTFNPTFLGPYIGLQAKIDSSDARFESTGEQVFTSPSGDVNKLFNHIVSPTNGFHSTYVMYDPLSVITDYAASNSLKVSSEIGLEFDFDVTEAGINKYGTILLSPNEASLSVNGLPYVATQPENIATKKYVDDAVAGGGGSVSYNKAKWTSTLSASYNLGSTPKANSLVVWIYGTGSATGILRERLNISDPPSAYDYYVSGTNVIFNTSSTFWSVGTLYYFQWAY